MVRRADINVSGDSAGVVLGSETACMVDRNGIMGIATVRWSSPSQIGREIEKSPAFLVFKVVN